jgi:alpha-beta hydrolase superfamily lysophospholipase
MGTEESSLTTADGLRLHLTDWKPEATTRAVVCLVHGIGEHVGRYRHVADALNRAGFSLVGMDLRGHGKSEGPRGYIPSFDVLLDDIALQIDFAGRAYAGHPVFLYGHSLGGSLVLYYAIRRRPSLAGVVATGPQLRLAFQPPAWKTALGRLLLNVYPGFSMPSGLEVAALSHDPQVVRAYVEDPLVHDRVSPRLGIGLIDNGLWLLEHAGEFTLPLLIMHGGDDRITSPEATREFAGKVPGDCTLKIWDGLYHEIHNESQKGQVLGFMIDWLGKHCR